MTVVGDGVVEPRDTLQSEGSTRVARSDGIAVGQMRRNGRCTHGDRPALVAKGNLLSPQAAAGETEPPVDGLVDLATTWEPQAHQQDPNRSSERLFHANLRFEEHGCGTPGGTRRRAERRTLVC